MKLAHGLAFVTLFFMAGCVEDDAAPVQSSSDPTPAQLSQALSDPLFVDAVDILASDGLGVDREAGHVITDADGNWALELPVVAFYSGDLVHYESLVYEVVAGAADVYFLLADEPRVETEGSAAASNQPGLGQVTLNAVVCGPWTPWQPQDQEWWCGPTPRCPYRTLMHQEWRARWCQHPGGFMERVRQEKRVFQRCGC